MEILIGEQPGGEFFADRLIEKDGAKYEKESHGSPMLPVFRIADGKMLVPKPTNGCRPTEKVDRSGAPRRRRAVSFSALCA